MVNVPDLFHGIIAYNEYYLRANLHSNSLEFFKQFPNLPLHEHRPLDIVGDETGKALTSFKHPWDKEAAPTALRTASCYEA